MKILTSRALCASLLYSSVSDAVQTRHREGLRAFAKNRAPVSSDDGETFDVTTGDEGTDEYDEVIGLVECQGTACNRHAAIEEPSAPAPPADVPATKPAEVSEPATPAEVSKFPLKGTPGAGCGQVRTCGACIPLDYCGWSKSTAKCVEASTAVPALQVVQQCTPGAIALFDSLQMAELTEDQDLHMPTPPPYDHVDKRFYTNKPIVVDFDHALTCANPPCDCAEPPCGVEEAVVGCLVPPCAPAPLALPVQDVYPQAVAVPGALCAVPPCGPALQPVRIITPLASKTLGGDKTDATDATVASASTPKRKAPKKAAPKRAASDSASSSKIVNLDKKIKGLATRVTKVEKTEQMVDLSLDQINARLEKTMEDQQAFAAKNGIKLRFKEVRSAPKPTGGLPGLPGRPQAVLEMDVSPEGRVVREEDTQPGWSALEDKQYTAWKPTARGVYLATKEQTLVHCRQVGDRAETVSFACEKEPLPVRSKVPTELAEFEQDRPYKPDGQPLDPWPVNKTEDNTPPSSEVPRFKADGQEAFPPFTGDGKPQPYVQEVIMEGADGAPYVQRELVQPVGADPVKFPSAARPGQFETTSTGLVNGLPLTTDSFWNSCDGSYALPALVLKGCTYFAVAAEGYLSCGAALVGTSCGSDPVLYPFLSQAQDPGCVDYTSGCGNLRNVNEITTYKAGGEE